MSSRSLRKQVVVAMKVAGIKGQLYHGNKKIAREHYKGWILRDMLHMLSFKPGDIVHDCDAFNHRVKKILPYHMRWNKNTFVLDIDQLEFEDGRWSCGCPGGPMPKATREEIERYIIMTDEQIAVNKKGGWWSDKSQVIQDALQSGRHICDENGIKLPEFA